MTDTSPPRSLGETIYDARAAKRLGLREFARLIQIAPPYLSDIENDRRIPSEEVLVKIAQHLDLPFDHLMGLAGRVGEETEQYIRERPVAGALFRRISQRRLRDEELQKLMQEVEKLDKGEREE